MTNRIDGVKVKSKHFFLPIFYWRGNRIRCRWRFINPFQPGWKFRHVRDEYPGEGRVHRWWIVCVLFIAIVNDKSVVVETIKTNLEIPKKRPRLITEAEFILSPCSLIRRVARAFSLGLLKGGRR